MMTVKFRRDELPITARKIAKNQQLAKVTTTHRYRRVSNLKVQRDYYKAIEVVLQRTQSREDDELELDEKWIKENRV